MKKSLYRIACGLFLMAAAMGVNASCSSDSGNNSNYVCETCAHTPDALAENDGKAAGVYKGIVVGSSGTVSFDIQNGSNTITAVLTIDGVTATLTGNAVPVPNEVYVSDFVGTWSGQPVSVSFQVSADGSGAQVTSSSIPGHPNAVFTVYKETSSSLIEGFEGTYTKPGENGIFNILLSSALNGYSGISKNNGTGEINHIDGGYDSATGTLTSPAGTVMAHINGDNLQGQFQDQEGSVVVQGHRTL